MINFLIKKLIKDSENVQCTLVRTAYGKFSSTVGIFCNVILFFSKIIIGMISGSVSITADAVNNLSDASSCIISLLGFKMASKPADDEHPYGHGRYEYLSGLLVAVLIMVIGVELFKSGFSKIMNPAPVEFSWIFVGILVGSIILKLWMMFFNRKIGIKIDSQTLIATAVDSRNDVITTSAVLIASLISYFFNVDLDGWMGLAVAVFILVSSFGLIRDTLNPILGKAPDEKTIKEIQTRIMSYPGVLGVHDLMIHDYGPGRQFASIHVEMAAEDDVIVSHDVIDNIEHDISEVDGLQLIVHFDPISTSGSTANNLSFWLAEEVKIIHDELTIHDLRIVPDTTHTNLFFDCVKPNKLSMTDYEIKATISVLVKKAYPEYRCMITVDRSYIH